MLALDEHRRGDRLGIEAAQRNGGFHRDFRGAHGDLDRKRIGLDEGGLLRPREERYGQDDGAKQSEDPDVQCALQILLPDSVRWAALKLMRPE